MSKLNVEIPDFLRKRGITSVEDNIPNHHRVEAPTVGFMVLFGGTILERVKKNAESTCSESNVEPTVKNEPDNQPTQQELQELQELMAEREKSRKPDTPGNNQD
ncbi:MAG: hypothetical protein H6966_00640 [Chromatiaceae bacterium]|nr:hypothetical protein [Chromatiaceae bacterium]